MSHATDSPAFELSLAEYEVNDSAKGDYICFDAFLNARGFAGHTHFWVSRAHCDAFLADLTRLDKTLRGDVTWRAGWGDIEYFSLSLSPFGGSGRQLARVALTADGPREEERRRVEVEFVVMPQALSEFRTQLLHLVTDQATGVAALPEDREAAV